MTVTATSRLWRVASVAVALTLAGIWGAPIAGAQVTAPPTYYVNSLMGNDAYAGTSPTTAWRTLTKAQKAPLVAGAKLLLVRGGDWVGKLTISASGVAGQPIVLSSYGVGPRPRIHNGGCVDLLGSNIVVQDIQTDTCTFSGVASSGAGNVVRDSTSMGNVVGVYIRAEATANKVLSNQLRDNNKMSVLTATPSGDDSGAWGVLLRGDGTEVAYNLITGSDSFSYDYVRDGSAVEIYGARSSLIHHNTAIDNNMFSELGNSRSADNVYAYNVVVSNLERGGFLTTRGAKSSYGPVLGTALYNNSVLLKGAVSEGIVCHAGCTPQILKMRNNVIQAVQKAGYADAPFDDGNGVYFGGKIQMPLGPGSVVASPQFLDPVGGNLRLLPTSPAVDSGDPSVPLFGTDIEGRRVPADGNGDGVAVIDRGAYERI